MDSYILEGMNIILKKKEVKMAKEKKARPISALVQLVVWITGILVSLAVGFAMADSVLTVRYIPLVVTVVAGWVVVVLTLLSVILAILDRI